MIAKYNRADLELLLASFFFTSFIALKKYENADLLMIASFFPYCLYKMYQSKLKNIYLPLIDLGITACLVVIALLLMGTYGKAFEVLVFSIIWVFLISYRRIYINSFNKEKK